MTEITPIDERIRAALIRHPDWTDGQIAKNTRGSNAQLVRLVRAGQPITGLVKPAVPKPVIHGVVSLDLVRKRYDTAQAIRDFIASLAPGELVLERDVCLQATGRDTTRFRRIVDTTEDLQACRIKLKLDKERSEGAWYWGRPDDIAEAKRLRDE